MVGVCLHLGLVANMAGRELRLSRGAGEERGISRALPMGSLRKREMEWGGLGRERPRGFLFKAGARVHRDGVHHVQGDDLQHSLARLVVLRGVPWIGECYASHG
jgi:hypothetical protein